MRYDTPIFFQKVASGEYDPETGDYLDDSVKETLRYASIMDTGTEMLQLVYGKIVQGSLNVQIQNHYLESFDSIRIGNKTYQVDFVKNLRLKQIFVVSEVL